MEYTKTDLEHILEKDFLLNPKAFSPGRTNDDMVDSMLICFALDREWTELFAKWVDNYTITGMNGKEYLERSAVKLSDKEPEIKRILEHYERVKGWLEDKEKYTDWERGDLEIVEQRGRITAKTVLGAEHLRSIRLAKPPWSTDATQLVRLPNRSVYHTDKP